MPVPLDDVVAICERRILDGGIQDPEGKLRYLDMIRKADTLHLVFTPMGTGWGASPFDPKAWRTEGGQPILAKRSRR